MGRLIDRQTDEVFFLRAGHLLGRGDRCDTRYDRPEISQDHARIDWRNGRWVVRDLASSNGTTVDGRPLSGQAPIIHGQRIALGGVVELELIDAAAPQPFAISSSGQVVEGIERELYLPRVEDFEAVILPEEGGDWIMTCEGEERVVRDGGRVRVGGVHWTLSLSSGSAGTRLTTVPRFSLDETRLRFEVSRDETTVRLIAVVGDEAIDLGVAAHNYTLLTLARAHLKDEAAGFPSMERGWCYRDELADQLKIKVGTFNVQLHRAKDVLGNRGWSDHKDLIQRRSEGQIRLSVGGLEIASA